METDTVAAHALMAVSAAAAAASNRDPPALGEQTLPETQLDLCCIMCTNKSPYIGPASSCQKNSELGVHIEIPQVGWSDRKCVALVLARQRVFHSTNLLKYLPLTCNFWAKRCNKKGRLSA